MSNAAPLITHFNGGEISPYMEGRHDFAALPHSCRRMRNYVAMPEGPATRRGGTMHVAAGADESAAIRVAPFIVDPDQAYILELGAGTMRFFKDKAQIVEGDISNAVSNGDFTSNITGWTDDSASGGSIAHDATNGRLSLVVSASGHSAAASQQMSGDIADSGEAVVSFEIVSTAPGDKVNIRYRDNGASGWINLSARFTGYHLMAIPWDQVASSGIVGIQFENNGSFRTKTVQIDNVAIVEGGALELKTPWAAADLAGLQWVQSTDTMYFFHRDYPAYKLLRYGNNEWSLERVDWQDGPYLDQNTNTTPTLTLGAASGMGVSCTATSGMFSPEDIGRLLRFEKTGGTLGWGVITGYTSSTVVAIDIRLSNGATAQTSGWSLGLYGAQNASPPQPEYAAGGYPAAGTFHEERLALAGPPVYPNRLDLSKGLFDIENFAPTDASGAVLDDSAVARSVAANQIARARWLASGDKLYMGSDGLVFKAGTGAGETIITPTSLTVRPALYGGVRRDVAPLGVSDTVLLYADRSGRVLRELVFDLAKEGYKGVPLSIRARHLFIGAEIVDIDYQAAPFQIVWLVLDTGDLLGLSYMRDEEVVAWHKHPLGANAADDVAVESVAVIPGGSAAPGQDETWFVVKRTIDGATHRYIEYLSDFDTEGAAIEDLVYLDSALSYSGGATATLSGLDHLEGETVHIAGIDTADSVFKYLGSATVAAGSVTIPASKQTTRAHAGLGMVTELTPVRRNFEAGDGGSALRTQRVAGPLSLLLERAGSYDLGDGTDFYTQSHAALFSGVDVADHPGGNDDEADIVLRQAATQPFPLTVCALQPQLTGANR